MSRKAESDSEPVLTASVHDVRDFLILLRSLSFVDRATITIQSTGLVFTVEEARTLLASAFVTKDIFDEFHFNPVASPVGRQDESSQSPDDSRETDIEEIATESVQLPLNTLIECLNIFGTAGASAQPSNKHRKWRPVDDTSDPEGTRDDNDGLGRSDRVSASRRIDHYFSRKEKRTGMRMTYPGRGYPLTLLVAEDSGGPTTICEITTHDAEPHLELKCDLNAVALWVILKSSWLRDALSELDPSYDKLTIIANESPGPDSRLSAKPMLRIQAAGSFGNTEMDYPDDREVFERFQCNQPVRFSYRLTHISKSLRALQSSTKTALRIDTSGVLQLQLMVRSHGTEDAPAPAFVDFWCQALDDDL